MKLTKILAVVLKSKLLFSLMLSVGLSLAGESKSVEGKLLAYDNKTFKVELDQGQRRYALGNLDFETQAQLHLFLGKKIKFNIESTLYYQTEKDQKK